MFGGAVAESDLGDERVGFCFRRLACSGGEDEFGATFGSESGGEDDDGGADFEEVFDEAIDKGRGVGVVGVDFIDDDDFSGEGEEAEGGEAGGEDGEEGLIDGTGAEGGEELAARGGEPAEGFVGVVVIAFGFLGVVIKMWRESADVVVFQPGIAVDEGLDGFDIGDFLEEILDAGVNFFGGELGWECEVEAAVVTFFPELVARGEGGFGFTEAHGSFDDVEASGVCGFDESGLEGAGLELSWGAGIEELAEGEIAF